MLLYKENNIQHHNKRFQLGITKRIFIINLLIISFKTNTQPILNLTDRLKTKTIPRVLIQFRRNLSHFTQV